MADKKGVIYILTNPSFPQYVKIGYAADVKQRLDELNRSTAMPFAFRVYATYEVDFALSDKKLHSILDKLNPELRSTEEIDVKRLIREFYAMTPEDAFSILEAIAEINDYHHRLKKWKATATEQREEALAQEIKEQHRERMAPFTFSKVGITIGEQIEFCCNGNEHSGESCEVVDDKRVKYNGETWSLTAPAKYLTGVKSAIDATVYVIRIDERAEPPYLTNSGKIYERLSFGSFTIKDSVRLSQIYNKREQLLSKLERKISIPPVAENTSNIYGYIDTGFALVVSDVQEACNAFDNVDLKEVAKKISGKMTSFNLSRIGNSIVYTPGGLSTPQGQLPAHTNNFLEIMADGSARMRILLINNNQDDSSVNMVLCGNCFEFV